MNTLFFNNMYKKTVFFALFLPLIFVLHGQKTEIQSSQNDEFLKTLARLSTQKLLDTANYYLLKNSLDSALICYNLVITATSSEFDMKIRANVHNRKGYIYTIMSDYRNAYKSYLEALLICEKYNIESEMPKIYNNIGNIFYHFGNYETAKNYYQKSISMTDSSKIYNPAYGNHAFIESMTENIDSISYFIEKLLDIAQKTGYQEVSVEAYNRIAAMYQTKKQYDSAYHYFRVALEVARKECGLEYELNVLSRLAKFFFEANKPDSALLYINLSDSIALKSNNLMVLADNYLVQSEYEESKGNIGKSFELYKKYVNLNNSLFNADIFSDINQQQRLYEVEKTNRQIEDLIIEKQIKERTLYLHKIIHRILFVVFALGSGVSLFIALQHKNLSKAHKVLVDKNVEIIKIQDTTTPKETEQPKKRKKEQKEPPSENIKNMELLKIIMEFMESSDEIYKRDFDMDRLAKLTNSSYHAVSNLINSTLKKNFNSFLNYYRIREAQKLLTESNIKKYTIETISKNVGYKSRTTFYTAFKEITGVSPKFYMESTANQPSQEKKKG